MALRHLSWKGNRIYVILLAVFLVSLFFRLWLLDKRWINADEGAHLMDAVLVLDGKIPQVDFGARQILYVYSIAGFLKLFGTNYVTGRLFPLACSMLIGIVIFLLARMLFDTKVALLSSAIYWMLPLEVSQSVIVKTEPLSILFTCLSLYAVVLFWQHSRWQWLTLAGVLAAMGYHVRESSLIILVTVFGFIVFFHKGRVWDVAKHLSLFLAGYVSVILLVLAFYSKFMSLGDLLMSGVNPFRPLTWAGEKMLSFVGLSLGSRNAVISQTSDVAWVFNFPYLNYFRQAFNLHLFLLVGLGFSVLTCCYNLYTRSRREIRKYIISHCFLYIWFLSLVIAYGFYYFAQGHFFIDYFREFLPPLVIILSAWMFSAAPALAKDGVLERFIVGGLCLSVGLFFIESYYEVIGIGYHASIAVAVFALFSLVWSFESSARRLVFLISMVSILVLILFSRQAPLEAYFSGTVPSLAMIGIIYGVSWLFMEKEGGVPLARYGKFISLSILFASFAVSVSYSANLLNLAYDSEWSPESVKMTVDILKAHTRDDDEVMSGAVIWELQALRRPFLTISHPTAFIGSMSEKKRESIRNGIRTNPPKVIILDGFTEKTYFSRLPWLTGLLRARYQLLATVGASNYPISIYLESQFVGSTDNL